MLQDGNSREPEILLGIIWTVASYMDTRSAKQCATRFDKVLSRDFKSNSVGACKAACKLLLKLNEQQGDGYLKTLRSIAVDLRGLLGSVADTDHRGDPRQYHNIVTVDSAKAVIAVVIAGVEGVMEEISWAITKLKELMVGVVELEDDFAEATAGRRKSVGADSGLVGRIEAATHSRLDKVIEVLEPLTALDMPNWASTELILRMVVKLYRELKAATKLLFVTKVSPPKSFKLVIKHAHNRIASHVYELLQILNAGGNDTAEGVAKKELALVPALVFSMEDLEKELIKYGKQCKENLMRGHKRSTVRDFKINDEKIIDMRHDADEAAAAAAAAAAEENEEEEEEDDGEEDAEHQKDENRDEDDEGEEGEEHAEDEEDDEDEADAGNRFVDDEAGGSSEENSDEEHSYGAYGGRTHQTTKRRKLRYIASPVASVLPSDEEELLDDEDEEEEDREDDDATQGEMDEEEQDSLELGSGDDADSD